MRLRIFCTQSRKELERAEKESYWRDQHVRQRMNGHLCNYGADILIDIQPTIIQHAVVAKRVKRDTCCQECHDCAERWPEILPNHELARYDLNSVRLS